MAFRLSSDFSAFTYCTVPSTALRISTAKMTIVLSTLPEQAEIIAAIIKMHTIKSRNCSAKIRTMLFFFPSDSLFFP